MATKRKTSTKVRSDESTAESENEVDYERTLAELEAIVERMETEQQPLEKAVKDFERGMALSRACLASLKRAETRIDKLMVASRDSDGDADAVTPFAIEE